MNCSTIRSHFEQVQDSFTSFVHRFGISCTSQRCQVHPEIGRNQSLDFINLGSQRIVRVLHIPPKPFSRCFTSLTAKVRERGNEEKETSVHLDISSEEYWFTRANRPYRLCDDCNRTPHSSKGSNLAEIQQNFEENCITDGINQMTVQVGGYLPVVSKSCFRLIDSFADSLSREVIAEVFRFIGKKLPLSNCFPSKDAALGNTVTVDSYKKFVRCNETVINYGPRVSAEILNIDLGSNKESTGVGTHQRTCHNHDDKVHNTSYGRCSSGIVNLSFSGSMSEPDEIPSSCNDYHKVLDSSSMGSPPIHYKFEASNSLKERLIDSESEINRISKVSVKFMSDGGASPSQELQEKPEEKPYHDTNKSSISKEDDGLEYMTQIDHIGELNNIVSTDHLDEKDPENNHDDGSFNKDRCVHTKNTQKPLLLFLHGVGSSADVWSVILEYFSEVGYEVLAPDMLGHGYSSAPDNRAAYTFDKLLQDVLQIFDRFVSDNQKCVAIGHSYGSCFAAALARYRPQQISQLVLLSSGGPSPLVPKQTLFSLHPCVVSLMKPFLMCGFKRDVFYAPRGKHLPSFCTYELPPYVMNHVERGQDWSDGDSAFHRRILVPTLLVHGLKDPHISLVEECEMERTIPRSFLEVLPNAGHMQMLDAPEQLCHMIHCFITWWNS